MLSPLSTTLTKTGGPVIGTNGTFQISLSRTTDHRELLCYGLAERRRNPPAFRISLAALLSFLALARAATAEEAAPFRLCADPDNLPFSGTSQDTPGFYIELGRELQQ